MHLYTSLLQFIISNADFSLFSCVIMAINLGPDGFFVKRRIISFIIVYAIHFSKRMNFKKYWLKLKKTPVVKWEFFKIFFYIFLQLFDIDDDYCGKHDFNTPINGPESVRASRAIGINTTASSLIVTTTHAGYTVAFIGTRAGHIKKVRHATFLTLSHAALWDRKDVL